MTSSPQDPQKQPGGTPSKPPSDENIKKRHEELVAFRSARTSGKKQATKGEDFISFAKENTKDTIAYVLLIVGILLSFFDSVNMYGGLLVGIIFGLYFSKEILWLWNNVNEFVEEHGIVKSLVLGGTLIALFVKAFWIFVGIAAIAAIKIFLVPESTSTGPDDKKL